MKSWTLVCSVGAVNLLFAVDSPENIFVSEGSRVITGPALTETMDVGVVPAGSENAELILMENAKLHFPTIGGRFVVGSTNGTGLASLTVSNAIISTVFNPNTGWSEYECERFKDAYDRAIRVGGSKGDGVVRLYENSAITNRISLGANRHIGAFYMYGGEVASLGGDANYGANCATCFGYGDGEYNGHGYFEMRDGVFNSFGSFSHNLWDAKSISYMTGGTFWMGKHPNGRNAWTAYFNVLSGAGQVHMYVGGRAQWRANANVYLMDNGSGTGVITVDDRAEMQFGSGEFKFGASSSRTEPFIINVNGGSISWTKAVMNSGPSSYIHDGVRDRAPVYLNFNGGTLKYAGSNYEPFGYMNGATEDPKYSTFSRITVFEKGGSFDTSPSVMRVKAELCPPTGCGVASIPLVAPISGYVAPPSITIEGDGYGASAIALYDSLTGLTTNILVTSHGCDYTTAVAKLYFNKVLYASVPCELADNVGGAITVRGSGYAVFSEKITVKEVVCDCASASGIYFNKDNIISSNTVVTVKSGSTARFETTSHEQKEMLPLSIRADVGFAGSGGMANRSVYRSICPSIEGSGNMSWGWATNEIVGCWKVDARKLVDNKARGYIPEYRGQHVRAMVFADTSTIDILDVSQLKPEDKCYTLLRANFDSTVYGNAKDFEGLPTLVGKAAGNWRLVHKDREIRLEYVPGMMLLVR